MRALPTVVVFAGVTSSACAPTFAPPIRTAHEAAGRMDPQGGMVRASVTGGGSTAALEGGMRVALTDRLALDLGGAFSDSFDVGFAGVRYQLTPPGRSRVAWAGDVDVDFGVGGGVGGKRCGNKDQTDTSSCDGTSDLSHDGRNSHSRIAFGSYGGVSAALHVTPWLSSFVTVRLQLSATTNVPATVWLSGLAGLDFRLGPVGFYGGIGVASFLNDVETQAGLIVEGGLVIHIGATRATPEAPAQPLVPATAPSP